MFTQVFLSKHLSVADRWGFSSSPLNLKVWALKPLFFNLKGNSCSRLYTFRLIFPSSAFPRSIDLLQTTLWFLHCLAANTNGAEVSLCHWAMAAVPQWKPVFQPERLPSSPAPPSPKITAHEETKFNNKRDTLKLSNSGYKICVGNQQCSFFFALAPAQQTTHFPVL